MDTATERAPTASIMKVDRVGLGGGDKSGWHSHLRGAPETS